MCHFVIVREGIVGEDGTFDELFQAIQLPQPEEHLVWYLWAEICSGYEDSPHWERNENWMHENGVRRFWHRDMPSITVEIKVKEMS